LFNSDTNMEVQSEFVAYKLISYMSGDKCQTSTEGYKYAEELLSKDPQFLQMVHSKVKELFAQRVNQTCDIHDLQ
jgi:hypothetical protein